MSFFSRLFATFSCEAKEDAVMSLPLPIESLTGPNVMLPR